MKIPFISKAIQSVKTKRAEKRSQQRAVRPNDLYMPWSGPRVTAPPGSHTLRQQAVLAQHTELDKARRVHEHNRLGPLYEGTAPHESKLVWSDPGDYIHPNK